MWAIQYISLFKTVCERLKVIYNELHGFKKYSKTNTVQKLQQIVQWSEHNISPHKGSHNQYRIQYSTRSQAVARIADRTAKKSSGHVT